MIRTLLVDDEDYAREELKYLLETHDDFTVVAECNNAIEGLKTINTLKPDVVFLDIKMPKVSGIELASMLDTATMPRIVFVTAYDEFAIAAFENNAIDYLLKPVEKKRFDQTLQRLRDDMAPQGQINHILAEKLELIPCYKGARNYLINCNEIEYAYSNPVTGVHLITKDHEYHTTLSLKTLEEKSNLIRCHRQYLVNAQTVKLVEKFENGLGSTHTYSGHTIPVSRRFMNAM